jgi:hypothetical protein
MSLTRLFFKPNTKSISKTGTSAGGIDFDCFVSETHNRSADLTKFPIEDGSIISDHVVNNPIELTINGLKSAIGMTLYDIKLPDSHITAFEKINILMDDKELVRVVTSLKVYENMHISSFSVPRNKETANTLDFTMTLVQAKIVNTLLTEVPNSQLGGDTTTNLQAQTPADVGTQVGDDAEKLGLLTEVKKGFYKAVSGLAGVGF